MGVSTSKCMIYFSWYFPRPLTHTLLALPPPPPLLFTHWEPEYPIISAVARDASPPTIILAIL